MYRDLTKRIMALALSVCMIAGMVDLSGLTVRAEEAEQEPDRTITEAYIEVTDPGLIYNGVAQDLPKANVKVEDAGTGEEVSADLYKVIECTNNINAGTAHAVIVNVNDAEDKQSVDYSIGRRPISKDDPDFTFPDREDLHKWIINRTADTTVTLDDVLMPKYKGQPMNRNDYSLDNYKKNWGTADENDTWEASVEVVGDRNFTGSVEIPFDITVLKRELLTFSIGDYSSGSAYNGKPKTPAVKAVYYDGVELESIAFETHYKNNVNAGTALVWIEITEDGKYKGLKSVETEETYNSFIIRKILNRTYTLEDGTDTSIKVEVKDQPYTAMSGFTVKPEDIVVRDPGYDSPDDVLKLNEDYTIGSCKVTEYDFQTGEGTGEVVINAAINADGTTGRYMGATKGTFKVTAPKLVEDMVHIDDAQFMYDIKADGTDKEWYTVVENTIKVGEDSDDYRRERDYKVEAVGGDKGTSAEKHQVKITALAGGKLKAGDTVIKTYEVKKRPLDDSGVFFRNISNTLYRYNGAERKPELELSYRSEESGGERTLVADRDYIAKYSDNKNATTDTTKALAWAEGMENGNFSGATRDKKSFTIDPRNLEEDANITIEWLEENEEFQYTGKGIEPRVNVKYAGETDLVKGKDYTISYSGNQNVVRNDAGEVQGGTAEIVISGINNYTGEISRKFTILPRDLRDVTVARIPDQQYTGEKLRPEVKLTYAGTDLTAGTEENTTGDYVAEYSDHIQRGQAKVTLTGRGNYTGTKETSFTIGQRNIRTGGILKIFHKGETENLVEGSKDDHAHEYTGNEINFPLTVQLIFDDGHGTEVERILIPKNEDDPDAYYDYEPKFTNNTDIGTAEVTIVSNKDGNYTGNYTVEFAIKGNIEDSFADIQIPEQIYSNKEIIPENAEVKFEAVETRYLQFNKDYKITSCVNNTQTGIATATIEGVGDYCGVRTATFRIVPFDLSKPDPKDNEYKIEMEKVYTFCDTDKPIEPIPEVYHNSETPLVYGMNNDYKVIGYENNDRAGQASLTIGSDNYNYMGTRSVDFTINPYVIGDEQRNPTSQIQVMGIRDVIVDNVLDHPEDNADIEIKRDGSVEMSNLQVMYTPVGLDGTEYEARALNDDEYEVTYTDNDKIGTATITIEGKGNFTGKITKTFRIRGDLSSERTQVSIDDCVYSPKGNTPVPVVTYTYNREEVTLTEGEDYTVEYDGNTNATLGDTKAKAIIHPVYEGEGDDRTVKGNYTQSGEEAREEEFTIEQRDLSKAFDTEENEKDPLLEVTGLVEDGYEYTGSDIEPQLRITCDGGDVMAGDDYNAGDYKIEFDANKNVYTFAEDENGEQGERLMPTVTIEATKDSDGNYTGNYKNGFTLEFKINPREISENTISTLLWVDNKKYTDTQIPEVDYNNGEEITFPKESDPSKNDIDVTWNKQGQEVDLEEDTDYLVSYDKNRRIGEAEITISGPEFGNYSGEYKRTFKIMASIEEVDKEEPQYMTLKDGYEDVPFGIVAVYPKLEFIDVSGGSEEEAYILEEGKDFEVVTTENQGTSERVSSNNINVRDKNAEEPPTVVVRGIGCYRGEIERTYNIIPKDLTTDDGDITIEFVGALNTENYENAFIYSGQAIEPEVNVYNHGQLMTKGEDYTVAGYRNNTVISKDDLKASVVIRAASGGNYTGEKTFYYNIIKHPIDEMTVTITSDAQVYSRTQKKPEVEVSYVENSQRKVLDKSNYDVTYENNIVAAAESAGEDAPTIVITGKGSYGGTIRKTFTIAPEPLDESNDDFVITSKNVEYTGLDMTTEITVKAKDGTLLEEEKDYVITGYKNNKNAGTGYVTIRGNGNYTGTRDVPFRIIAPDVSNRFRISDITDQIYTGSPIEPQVSVAVAEGESEIPLTSDEYELEYENNTNVGTASVIVRGTGNYGGAKRVTFKITPKSIGAEGIMAADMLLADIEDQLYTGRGVTPDVSLTRRGQTGQADELLVLGKDYTLSYLTNVAVGTASVNIIGIGNYTGNIQKQFRILGPMNLADVAKINAQPYTGSAVTPEPNVSYAGKKLTKGEDYTLVYEDNVTQGTAKITITGQGMYTGEKIVTFEIARDFSNETIVKGMAAAYTYTGKAIKPVVLVEDHGRILSNGTDFKVSYSNNINVGTATVTVTGVGAYSGTASAQFKITPQNIGRAAVSKVADQTYDGKDKKPSVSVSSDGIALKNGTDYTVVHVDNKNPGKASIVIKGKGNFTGTQTVNYNIIVPKVTGVKVSGYTDTTITFSWKRNKVVTGYEIYNSRNKRVARVKKNSMLEASVSKLKAGSTETFRVRAYVTRGQYYYSDFVSIKAGTAPKATRITGITSSKSKQVELKWKKVTGATQYQIYRSTSKNGKYKKLATTKKTSYTDKKATGGKTYYYQIRVGKKNGSKTYYSYSKVKSVAAKK